MEATLTPPKDTQIDQLKAQISALRSELARNFSNNEIDSLNQVMLDSFLNNNNSGKGELCMKGKIRGRESKCKRCGGRFKDTGKAIGCPSCFTTPTAYIIDLHHKGARERITRDKSGHLLDSYARAARELARIRAEIDDNVFNPKYYRRSFAEKFYFERFGWRWFERTKDNLAPTTKAKREYALKNHYIPFFGTQNLREIDADIIMDFLQGIRKKGFSWSHEKWLLATLHVLFSDALKWGLIEKVPSFPHIQEKEEPIQWIDRETQIKVLRKIKPKHRPIFRLLFLTGIRIAEGRGLMWDAVDFNNRIIYIRRIFSLGELRNVTKTNNWRALPMTDKIYNLLHKQKKGLGFVFINPTTGKPYAKNINAIWRRACKKANVDIRLYNGTRHSFFSQRAKEGFHLEEMQKIAGHTSTKTTEKYARIVTENLLPVMEGKKVISINRQKTVKSKMRGSRIS